MTLLSITRSLSARLLVLTIFFVMLAEVLIYTPSIARFRQTWLEEKLVEGQLAALSIAAAPEGMVTADLERELLGHVGGYVVDLTKPNQRTYMLGSVNPPEPDRIVDLDQHDVARLIRDAFDSLLHGEHRVLRIQGRSPRDPEARVMMILDERPLQEAMVAFSWRILGLSIVISLITAGLVFLSLRWLTVRPLTRLTATMVAFRQNPDDAASIIVPSGRADEVGTAERELRDMQIALRGALKQQARLAALGTAMTKINHDLRNILATAALVSEHLGASGDPEVRRTTPRLMAAIDRAIELCSRTLAYTSEGGPPLHRMPVPLRAVVDAAEADLAAVRNGQSRWVNAVPEGLTVLADREQLLRVLINLGRNAFEAGAGTVTVSAAATADGIRITVADDGPGLPPRARAHLFQPFAGAGRPGGTGLGLAIAREIMAAHRGDIKLVDSGAGGTTFSLLLPA